MFLKDIHFPVALITKILKNEDGSTGIYLASNDLETSANRIYGVFQKRSCIEEYHKSIKQKTSLEKSPTKMARSQGNHIFASIFGYRKLEFLKTKTLLNRFALKYKLLVKANQEAFKECGNFFESTATAQSELSQRLNRIIDVTITVFFLQFYNSFGESPTNFLPRTLFKCSYLFF